MKGEEVDDPILMTHISINKENIDTWYPEDGSPPPRPAALMQDGEGEEEMMDDDICQGEDGGGIRVGFGNLGEQVPFAVQVREGIEAVGR